MATYFYAISRRDLPVHQQAIQSAHAQLEYCRLFGTPTGGDHPNFVWLTVGTKRDLLNLAGMLCSFGVDTCLFQDPDYPGYDPSAIACFLQAEQRYYLSDLPLWKCAPPRRPGLLSRVKSLLSSRKGGSLKWAKTTGLSSTVALS